MHSRFARISSRYRSLQSRAQRVLALACALWVSLIVLTAPAAARDHMHIVGSSTVFPFITTVAEEFGQKTPFATPIVEQLGTGGGLKLFCSGLGATAPFDYPDFANASRQIKPSEAAFCKRNGITNILEINIGFDGIVIANAINAPAFQLTTRQLYLALAKQVPAGQGSGADMIDNPYERWNEIAPDLPNLPIKVLGPPQTSGTRDAFNSLAIEAGCRTFPALKALKDSAPRRYAQLCRSVREDQRYIEAGENDNLVVQKLRADPEMLGILPYSFLEQNADVIKAAPINSSIASPTSIRSGAYPIARSMFVYVKTAHARSVPGMEAFLMELLSDEAMGPYGYLVDKGLITLPASQRAFLRSRAQSLSALLGELKAGGLEE